MVVHIRWETSRLVAVPKDIGHVTWSHWRGRCLPAAESTPTWRRQAALWESHPLTSPVLLTPLDLLFSTGSYWACRWMLNSRPEINNYLPDWLHYVEAGHHPLPVYPLHLRLQVQDRFVEWWRLNYLQPSVTKTKDLVVDSRIHEVDNVDCYKCPHGQ